LKDFLNPKSKKFLIFVYYLKTWKKREKRPKSVAKIASKNDPILKFIGGISHGSLAKDIDKDLYGG